MKKLLTFLFAALFAAPSFSAAKKVRLDLFFGCMDSRGWQWFFTADSLNRRSGKVSLNVYCIISKDKKGKWSSPRGRVEVDESKRVAVVSKYHREKLLYYLNGRSLSPWRGGWIDAAIFAQIDPDLFKKEVEEKGDAALEEHYKKAARFGVKEKSLFINGKKYKGEMRLSDLMKEINAYLPQKSRFNLYPNRKTRIKTPKLIVLTDNKFASVNSRVVDTFKRYFSRIEPQVVDYTSNKIFKTDYLPAYLLEDNKETREIFSALIKGGVFEEKDGYLVYYDRENRGIFVNRKKEKGRLELFVMSQCPYGTQAENSIIAAYEKNLLPEGTKIEIHFIADGFAKNGDYDFKSLHGKEEWEEDARQIYIAKNYPLKKFFAYLKERNKNYRSSDWKSAARKAGISVSKIEKNFKKAKKLLYEDTKYADSLKITTSPSFIVDGRYFMVGLRRLKGMKGYEKLPEVNADGSCK